jgi:hypothetical protein
LLQPLIADQTLNLFFLRGGERAATSCRTTTLARIDAARAILLKAIDDHAPRRIAQAKITGNLATIHTALVGANDLTATFMLCLWR